MPTSNSLWPAGHSLRRPRPLDRVGGAQLAGTQRRVGAGPDARAGRIAPSTDRRPPRTRPGQPGHADVFPWEHAAVGYVAFSLLHRAVRGEPPDGAAAVAVLAAALLPDLVDKPLAWEFAVLPSGRSLAHSLLVAVPATLLVWLGFGRRVGGAFGLSYGLHLVTDVYYPIVYGQAPVYSFLLYPLVDAPASGGTSFVGHTLELIGNLLEFATTAQGRVYLLFELMLMGAAGLLWLLDGLPGLLGWEDSRRRRRDSSWDR